jgi:hypothetical protein
MNECTLDKVVKSIWLRTSFRIIRAERIIPKREWNTNQICMYASFSKMQMLDPSRFVYLEGAMERI